MPYDHLSQFVTGLAGSGQLVRLTDEIQPVAEIASLVRRACSDSQGGPALLIENVAGAKFPLVANLFGGRRLLTALDAEAPSDVICRIQDWLASLTADPASESTRSSSSQTRSSRLAPRYLKTAFVQQVIRMGKDVDLGEFPFPRWEGESAPTISNAITILPGDGGSPVHWEMPVLQVADRSSLIVHWTAHHAGPRVYERARQQGKPIPVVAVMGADPALLWACAAPRPPGVDPFLLASIVRGLGLNLVRGRTVELDVPGDAEIVIEGYVDPQEVPDGRGAVASGRGYLTERTDLPRLRVTAVTHRANPVVPVTIRHPSPCEADGFQELSECLLESEIRRSFPDVQQVRLVRTGESPRVLFVALRKDYPGQARQVMHALWGMRWLTGLKCIVVVDEGRPLDERSVWQAVATYVDPERDVIIDKGTADFDDHSLWPGFGSQMGIDATRKRADEGSIDWPDSLESPAASQSRIDYLWSKAGWNRS